MFLRKRHPGGVSLSGTGGCVLKSMSSEMYLSRQLVLESRLCIHSEHRRHVKLAHTSQLASISSDYKQTFTNKNPVRFMLKIFRFGLEKTLPRLLHLQPSNHVRSEPLSFPYRLKDTPVAISMHN